MFAAERHKRILELLEQEGSVWVSKLSIELGVTEETVRRDLEKLESNELLMRTHGGAIPISRTSYELSLEKRKKTNADIKQRLAKEACKHIVPGDTIFLDASTTTFYMAREMKNIKKLTVITNSMRAINELAGCENLKVICVGGKVSDNMSLIGEMAVKNISEQYYAQKFFFSSRGVNLKGGIMESNEYEHEIKAAMLKNSNEAYYLCDSSKVGKVGFAKLAAFENIDCFITDANLDEDIKNALYEADVEIEEII